MALLTLNCSCGLSIRSVGVGGGNGGGTSLSLFDQVFGQADLRSDNSEASGLYNPFRPVSAAGKLILVDQYNQRVLIWNSPPASASVPPDVVLGQPNLYASEVPASATASTLNSPNGVCSDGTKLAVSDTNNNRVLIWNTIPTASFTPADVVLGQADFTSVAANRGGTVSAVTLRGPRGIHCSGSRLWVADASNNRVLFWNSIPTVSGTAASGVLGQPDLVSATANNGGRGASTMSGPESVAEVSGNLAVVDRLNHRVLLWNTATPSSLAPATSVLGQSSLTAGTMNSGGISAYSLAHPIDVAAVGTGLYVSDSYNHRVLGWNTVPAVWTTPADVILGQSANNQGTANNGGRSAQTLNSPSGVGTDGTRLFVADTYNSRLLIFNAIPAPGMGIAADRVWGQSSFAGGSVGNGQDPAASLSRPLLLSDDGQNAWVADSRHCRVLRFRLPATPFSGAGPDLALGQPDLSSTNCAATANNFGDPNPGNNAVGVGQVASNNSKLYAAATNQNRILIWNTMPATSGAAPDAVLGQASMTAVTSNSGGVSADSLNRPFSVIIVGSKLIVADSNNHRVLIWNSLPTARTPADVVLGQPASTANTANNGGVSASSMSNPRCVFSDGTRLFVCDMSNHRILVWNTIPASTVAADHVIGQPDFTSNQKNAGQASIHAAGLSSPQGLAYNGKKLFVADTGNHRVLVWNAYPATPGQPANAVYGQADLTQGTANPDGVTAGSLESPIGLLLQGADLWVSDFANNRLLLRRNAD